MPLLSEPYEESGYVILSGELIKYAHVFRSGLHVPYLRSGSIANRWNELPEHVKNAQNTNSFKNNLDELHWFKEILYDYDR